MSDTTPSNEPTLKQLTTTEHETLVGRLGALEILMTQAWVATLKSYPEAHRDAFVKDAMTHIEDRVESLSLIAQTAAVESAESILSIALATVRQPGAQNNQSGPSPTLN